MPSGMYTTIHLLEIMRRSAFKSPLSYPSSQVIGMGRGPVYSCTCIYCTTSLWVLYTRLVFEVHQCTLFQFCTSHQSAQRRYDMNGRFQLQGGKNWILLIETNANRFFWDGTLIGWSGQTSFVPIWDRMEGAWLYGLWLTNGMFIHGRIVLVR